MACGIVAGTCGFFRRTVQACVAAGIAKGDVVHADASPVRADVSRESAPVRVKPGFSAETPEKPGFWLDFRRHFAGISRPLPVSEIRDCLAGWLLATGAMP